MTLNYKQLDNFPLTGNTEYKFACDISEDDRIFIITTAGIYVLHLKADLKCNLPQFSCRKVFFNCSEYYICENVNIDGNTIIHMLPKELHYEYMARVDLSANYNKMPPNPEIVSAQWSGRDMIDSSFCMLAVMTNLHYVEIYAFSVNENDLGQYHLILNLTERFLNSAQKEFVYSDRFPPVEKFYELKKRVEYVAATAFCWGHTFQLNTKLCTILIMGHFHGFVTVWQIFSMNLTDSNVECEMLGRFSTKLGQINALYWHKINTYEGALCIGDINGHLSVLQIKNLDNSNCTMENELNLYNKNDLKLEKIFIATVDDYIAIVAVKQTNLLFYFLNVIGEVVDSISHCAKNVQNIVGITVRKHQIKVLTENCELFQYTLLPPNNGQLFELREEQIKLDINKFNAHGFFESKNQVLLGILTRPGSLSAIGRLKKQCVNFQLYTNTSLNGVEILINNETGSLRDYWDCLECIRLNCLKEHIFPWEGNKINIDYDNSSLYQLKLQRQLAQISETVFPVIKEITHYDIKPFVYINYLVEIEVITRRLNQLIDKLENGEKLSDFVMRTIYLQIFYLKDLIIQDVLAKANVGANFVQKLTHLLSRTNDISFPDMIQCKLCGETLLGSTCFPPHADSRCSITMYQIFILPGYKCLMCQSLAHSNAQLTESELNGKLLCPYCDVPMNRINATESLQSVLINENDEVKSTCFSDCLLDHESIEVEDKEMTEVDDALIMISDDDEDDDDDAAVKKDGNDETLNMYFDMYSECCNMLYECKIENG